MRKLSLLIYILLIPFSYICSQEQARPFVHPGMMQNKEDLEYMRDKVLKQTPEWQKAFVNLQKETSLDFKPEPVAHVSVGPYGSSDIGGKALFASAKASYNHALMWYITKDKRYAGKAIEILNAWSYKLWGFDANNAKLNVGLTGYFFLNAAEIIRHTYDGWNKKDMEQFNSMLLTVFYPTIEDFFVEANGNWDASIINTMMCIGIFTDNHEIFNRAVDWYYRGEGNGGITRYIYPGGQCQETTRDWDHVQLGIGEFAKAARVAWTQGIDFYDVADNRLAAGFEYAAAFMTGHDVNLYGTLSHRDKDRFRDIYEWIYDHYKNEKGIRLPYVENLILEHTRPASSVGFLTAATKPQKKHETLTDLSAVLPALVAGPSETGALETEGMAFPENAVYVQAGEAIQDKIDAATGGTWIVLKKGVHTLNEPLRIRNNITFSGEGKSTILFLNPEVQTATIVNAEKDMRNVTIRDMLIEGADKTETGFDPNYDRSQRLFSNASSRGGIVFTADSEGQMNNIKLENITVQNFTKNGVFIAGANNVSVLKCDITNNGSAVVPGAGFHHNLKLLYVNNVMINSNRMDDSMWGNGVDLAFCKNINIEKNEISRNKRSGINSVESENINIKGNLIEGNNLDGISLLSRMNNNRKVRVDSNKIQNTNRYGISFKGLDNESYIDNNIYFYNRWDESGE